MECSLLALSGHQLVHPDDKACASAVLAAAAGGSLSDVETTPAMTAKDAHATFDIRRKGSKGLPERRARLGSGEDLAKGEHRHSTEQAG